MARLAEPRPKPVSNERWRGHLDPAHILQAEGVVSIDFEDMLNGHVVGQASEWITDDGGDTWIEVTP